MTIQPFQARVQNAFAERERRSRLETETVFWPDLRLGPYGPEAM